MKPANETSASPDISGGEGAAIPHDMLPGAGEIDQLFVALGRTDLPPATRKLLVGKVPKKAKKLIEEAAEVAIDALAGRRKGVINESVDVLYHLVVLWRACGIKPQQIWEEMSRRARDQGVAGKLPKSPKRTATGIGKEATTPSGTDAE